MYDSYESMENELSETSKENENFNEKYDRLLEASLANDVMNCVAHSYVEIDNESLRKEIKIISRESKDIQESLFKGIVIQMCLWIIDRRCSKHMTGDLKMVRNFVEEFIEDLDDLFIPLYDEYFEGKTPNVSTSDNSAAPDTPHDTYSSTTISVDSDEAYHIIFTSIEQTHVQSNDIAAGS
nr:hypothetical protein [Tanacetum cinerariifolium]